MGYFKRALGLSRPEWKLVACALLCLACNNAATLALPNFQGSILDAVVRSDKKRFGEDIALYLGISMTTGLIGGVQSLCFLIVGRKMANAARNKLFRGILSADVAFHDGNSSGSLTSRLSQDVSAMVSPCTTMLGTLFSNIVLLFGGVIMCFATSWRLSMLAFTTVAPIIQITQAYASFSRKLNRDIYAALAEASGLATEALSNVRTVKAFSTEQYEMARYNEATSVALQKGIKDAVAGAGAYTINNYLDLSASVLILFYGGHLAMEHDERLTAGKLISYQLYWNLINSSYQQLVNIVTSFTRAAGAAQRVFSLMDQVSHLTCIHHVYVSYAHNTQVCSCVMF
jgi:ABC-type multidrug transport system fused ATPase/permease subunit